MQIIYSASILVALIALGAASALQQPGFLHEDISTSVGPLFKVVDKSFRRLEGDISPVQVVVGADSKDLNDVGGPRATVEIRTATGGLIYTLMVTLTVVAFLSNGAFLVYVFWLSK